MAIVLNDGIDGQLDTTIVLQNRDYMYYYVWYYILTGDQKGWITEYRMEMMKFDEL